MLGGVIREITTRELVSGGMLYVRVRVAINAVRSVGKGIVCLLW